MDHNVGGKEDQERRRSGVHATREVAFSGARALKRAVDDGCRCWRSIEESWMEEGVVVMVVVVGDEKVGVE